MNKTILKTLAIVIVCLAVGFSVGFFVGDESAVNRVNRLSEPSQQTIPTPEKQQEKQEAQDKYVFIEKSIGDEIELATIKFKVNKTKEKQTLSGSFGTPAIAKENAKFVIIDLSITNITNSDFTFFPDDGFKLVDNKERQFTSYDDTIGNIENYLNVRELAPSIKESGVIVYEIPKDATGYSLFTGKVGTKEIYKVKLK